MWAISISLLRILRDLKFLGLGYMLSFILTPSFCCAVIDDYDYAFSENGLVAHKDGKLIGTEVLVTA